MEPIQAMMDGMNADWQRERAKTQMALGKMIEVLEAMPATTEIEGLGKFDSYRGYYCDLAFEPIKGKRPTSDILEQCRDAMGQVFTGYKGGKFMMGKLTPLWLAGYGDCGEKIIAIRSDGTVETEREDLDSA